MTAPRFPPHVCRAAVVGLSGLACALPGCTKDDRAPTPALSAAAPASSVPAPAAAPVPPVSTASSTACTLEPEKVWGAGASVAAGMTRTALDAGRVAFGVVLGGRPDVLVVDAEGQAKLARVGVKKALSSPVKEGSKREILRVTPAVASGGEVVAYVDYRESSESERRVACGPSDSTNELLEFLGKPLLGEGDDKPPEPAKATGPAAAPPAPTPAPAPAANSPERAVAEKPAAAGTERQRPALRAADPARIAEMVKRKRLQKSAVPPGSASAGLPAAPPPTEQPKKEPVASPGKRQPKGDKVRELRDCRTLVDAGGAHAWAVGSELVGQPYDDGSTEWTLVFFARGERGGGRVDLSNSPLGKAPTRVPAFEVPVALDLGGGAFALAARYRGSVLAWLLDEAKRARGPARTYAGGTPLAPRLTPLGGEVLLSFLQRDASGRTTPRGVRFAPGATELPPALSDLAFPESEVTGSPFFFSAPPEGKRYVAYQAGETARRLSLAPWDPSGAPFWIDAGVIESSAVPLAGGRFLLVYLRAGPSGRTELVTRAAKCG